MNMKSKIKTGPEANKIGVRLETKRKFEQVAKRNRWSMVEAADAVVDDYIARQKHDDAQPAPASTGK